MCPLPVSTLKPFGTSFLPFLVGLAFFYLMTCVWWFEAVLKILIGAPLQPLKELTHYSPYPTLLPPIWASRKEEGYPQNLPSGIPSIGSLAGAWLTLKALDEID